MVYINIRTSGQVPIVMVTLPRCRRDGGPVPQADTAKETGATPLPQERLPIHWGGCAAPLAGAGLDPRGAGKT